MAETLQELLSNGSIFAYVALFFGIMLENAGIPLPGETALLIAGYLSGPAGGDRLHLWAVIVVSFLAAVCGDNLGYLLGRKLARPRLAAGKRFWFLTPERFVRAEGYFAKYGMATVFFGRWVALLRIAAGPAAGACGLPWWKFFLANAAGAAVWAAGVTLVGFFAGPAWQALQRWLGRGAWVALGIVVLAFLSWKVLNWARRRRTAVPPETKARV
ncbi:MAG: DedA family protein [Zavarzinella sp.]|nr:DedA family protein [Zavarzinella sp.]